MLFSNLIAEDTNAFQQLNRGRFFLFLASLHRYRLVIEKKKTTVQVLAEGHRNCCRHPYYTLTGSRLNCYFIDSMELTMIDFVRNENKMRFFSPKVWDLFLNMPFAN